MKRILKENIIEKCQNKVDQMIATATQSLQSAESAAQAETKSSMGDKFETTRAMMQAEVDKSKHQLAVAKSLKGELNAVKKIKATETVEHGSLVVTENFLFYISIGLGKITIGETVCFVISLASPIGQGLIGKRKDDYFIFNKNKIRILDIN